MLTPFKPIDFGRYRLTDRIAVGGMAEIFNARIRGALGFEKPLVIKRILPAFAKDAEFLRMFVTEAKLVCHLEHPNIVQVFELNHVEGQYYIAMEYVNGIDARKLWLSLAKRKQRLPGVLALFVVAELLKGLDYAHRALGPDGHALGVVHRDVSPSNVLISHRGDVKIGDFGVALVGHEAKSQAGVLKGKYGYMSPEQVAGMEVDQRSDIFAAGIVLAELLLGRRVFYGRSDFETLDKVMNVRLDVLERHERALPPEVVHIVRTALQRNVDERYQTAHDFMEDIAEFLAKRRKRITNDSLAAFLAEHVVPHAELTVSREMPAAASQPSISGAVSQPRVLLTTPSPVVPSEMVPAAMLETNSGRPGTLHDAPPPSRPGARTRELFGSPPVQGGVPLEESTGELFLDDLEEVPPAGVLERMGRASGQIYKTGPGKKSDREWRGDVGTDDEIYAAPIAAGRQSQDFGVVQPLGMRTDPELDDPLASDAALPMLTQVLDTAEEMRTRGRPDFVGAFGSRTMTKVLYRFALAGETGCLTVTGATARTTLVDMLDCVGQLLAEAWGRVPAGGGWTSEIALVNGHPQLISADRSEADLVSFLVFREVLSLDEIEAVVRGSTETGLLGLLTRAGLIGPLDVPRYLTAFVMQKVLDTFCLLGGEFVFSRDRSCSGESFPTGVDALGLISRGIANIPESQLDAHFAMLGNRRLAPNPAPSMLIDEFNPDDVLLGVYQMLAEMRPLAEVLARCYTLGNLLAVKRALYALIECELAEFVE